MMSNSLLSILRRRLHALIDRTALERDMDEEIRHHLDLEADRNQRLGMTASLATRQARLDFGGLDAMREAQRDARGARWL